MLDGWLTGLEASTLARALRDSVWVYPLVNTGHLLGVAVLVGSIVTLDLRLLGVWRKVPIWPLWRTLTQAAAAGLAVAVCFGLLLFSARATEYAASDFFIAKMTVIGVAVANALVLRAVVRGDMAHAQAEKPPRPVQIAAGVSLIAWLSALTLGRLVGYF
jgi:hypothetical protein